MNYVDPIPKGVENTRIDQGVDFIGSGDILAMGNGQVIETGGGGWPGGPYMTYKLLDGPDAGKVVYVAENIRPVVKAGDTVKAGQKIATMFNGGTGIETGWSNSAGTAPLSQDAAAGGISGADLPKGGTKVGRDYENFLVSVGVGKANNYNIPSGGKLPSGFDTPATGNVSPTTDTSGGTGLGGLLSFPTEITGFFKDANDFVTALMWITKPNNWIRIIAFLGGLAILLFAIHALMATANGEPIIKAPSVVPVPV